MDKIIFEPMYPAELYTSRPNDTALLSPIYDYTFKGIFTQETDESNIALKSFLSAVLTRKITQVTIKSNEPLKETKKQKNMTFDICVQFDNGEISDIEMQAWKQSYNYSMRAEIMIARLLSNNAKKRNKGERNWIAPKVYQISILNFHYAESDNEAMTWYTLQSDSGKKLSNRQNVIFIDLATIREKLGTPVEKLSPIERWGIFFSYVDDDSQKEYIGEILKQEEGIMAAEKIVKAMSKANSNWYAQNSRYIAECDANTNRYVAHQEGVAEGKAIGLSEGRLEGAQQKAIEDAMLLINKYKATPESAAKDVNAPLELVLEELEKTANKK